MKSAVKKTRNPRLTIHGRQVEWRKLVTYALMSNVGWRVLGHYALRRRLRLRLRSRLKVVLDRSLNLSLFIGRYQFNRGVNVRYVRA